MCCRKMSGYPAGDIMCVICIFGFEKDRLYNYINDKRWQRKYISTDRYIRANIKSEGSIKECNSYKSLITLFFCAPCR